MIIFVKIAISDIIRKLRGLPIRSELEIPIEKEETMKMEAKKLKAK
jgi:hypothetical protein